MTWSPISLTVCEWQVALGEMTVSESVEHWYFSFSRRVQNHVIPRSVLSLSWVQLCDPIDCSTPVFPVHHQLLELAQTHVQWVWEGSHHSPISSSVIPFFSCLQSFPISGFFPMSQFFTSGGQSIGVSALASVLPMNIQDWFPLGWTCWISLKSKGLSTVFSNTTVQKHKFFSAQVFFIIQLSHPYVTTGHDYSDPKLREK